MRLTRFKRLVALTCLACALTAAVRAEQADTLIYRLSLTDKAATRYSLDRPGEFLSAKAVERRRRQGIAVDSTDLPVCRAYVDAIARCGLRVVLTGRWENIVTVACADTARVEAALRLPFVRHAERVWTVPPPYIKGVNFRRDSLIDHSVRRDKAHPYGLATEQIALCRGDELHRAGFRGEGMTVAVIDAGFHNVDRIKLFEESRILGTRDFVRPGSGADLFAESHHGTGVLSCMAANVPGVMVGTAPEAGYWLLRTEDEYSEHLVEQDYWVAAVEFADSVGVDVVNTSLGYYTFDDATKNYEYRHLDGAHSLMSRQASRMAGKGMVLVCSAGNSGAGHWKKITPPADARDVLAVGAVDHNRRLAAFSSVGNTADGRVKPDVVAMGFGTCVITPNGNPGKANGTSFAAPVVCGLVACLWQALPQLTARQVIDLVRRCGDRALHPDNIYGYGVPDVWRAYCEASLFLPR